MKIIEQFFCCVMFLLITTSCGFAHIIDPDTSFEFQYKADLAEVAPVVDGFLDDPVWEEVESSKLDQEVKAGIPWQESDDFKGTFAAVWRNESLYLAVQLTDDQVDTYHEKLSRQDHLEIYLDIDHTGHKSDLYRYMIPVGEDASPSSSQLMLVVWSNDGQSCELSFSLGHTPRKEEVIGFGIYYNDVDQGHLQHKFGWEPVGQTESEDFLADLVFTARLKPNNNQKAIQWGGIKSLY